LIDFLGNRIQDHALDIKDVCISVFRKDSGNTARSLTFAPITKLIKLGIQQLDADALNIRGLAEMYLQEFAVGASKLGQTCMMTAIAVVVVVVVVVVITMN
jgi:hypothetical protein